MTSSSLALSEMLQGTPGIMPGVSSVVCIILLYSGWWETGTDGRTGTIYSSFEGVALPAPTAGHVSATAGSTDPCTHCSTSNPVSADFQRKDPAYIQSRKKYPLKRVRPAISADRLCQCAHTQMLLLIQQPSQPSTTAPLWRHPESAGAERLSSWGLPWSARQVFKVLQML